MNALAAADDAVAGGTGRAGCDDDDAPDGRLEPLAALPDSPDVPFGIRSSGGGHGGGTEPLAAPVAPPGPTSDTLRSLPLGDKGLAGVGEALGPRDFFLIVTMVSEAAPPWSCPSAASPERSRGTGICAASTTTKAGAAEGASELLSLAALAPKVAVEGQPKPDESEDAIAPGERG